MGLLRILANKMPHVHIKINAVFRERNNMLEKPPVFSFYLEIICIQQPKRHERDECQKEAPFIISLCRKRPCYRNQRDRPAFQLETVAPHPANHRLIISRCLILRSTEHSSIQNSLSGPCLTPLREFPTPPKIPDSQINALKWHTARFPMYSKNTDECTIDNL